MNASTTADRTAHPPIAPLTLFEILVRENADSLTAFLRAVTDDATAADDLFQDTMLVAWRRIGEYDRSRPFGAWLRGIARRLVLAYYRSKARVIHFSSEHVLDLIDDRLAEIDQRRGDTFDEKITALSDCIEQLEPLYHEPICLHYQQSKTAAWIAQHLSTTREAVQKRLQRARLQLAQCLQRKGVIAAMD